LTVLIPVHDRPVELSRCLAALGRGYPVIVVDDASADARAIADVCAAHGARCVRRNANGGAAAARNTGLAEIDTDLVAMVDSDCVAEPDVIERLAAHLADPLVAVAAPRIAAADARTAPFAARYAAARGILDQGPGEARVRPLTRVAFVPTAALVARRAALVDAGAFDETLRCGEDVDLIWRLHKAGWRIRYDPSVLVTHHEPDRWRVLLGRRLRYGASAGPLARRHPEAMAPMVLHLWPAVAVAGALTGQPLMAAAGYIGSGVQTRRALSRARVSTSRAVPMATGGIIQTWLAAGRYTTQLATPLLLAAIAKPGNPRRRLAAASMLFGAAATNWWRGGRTLDPIRFITGHVVDDVVYGAGVWRGAIANRTAVPLLPATSRRVRSNTVGDS